MKTLIQEILRAVAMALVTALILCGAYPLFVYGAGQLLFPRQANGSIITTRDGKALGSAWIGQAFSGARYFHPRPSAAGTGYDASNSGGTNWGPTSRKLAEFVKAAVAQYRAENGLPADAPVPADAVNSSGSGLDPHISIKNAKLQMARVARERNVEPSQVAALVAQYTDKPSLGFLGEPGVNVLKLNLALDGAIGQK